jgi:type I restriction enzyme M protein
MATAQTQTIVQRLWNYCNTLRDDGMSYGDYVEQLTYLLFLKMADERSRFLSSEQAVKVQAGIPAGYDWQSLREKNGIELEAHYLDILKTLGTKPGMLGVIFKKALNKIQDPAKLKRLIVDLIDKETWTGLSTDVKGDAYEGLLEKNAEDTKSGAGQYFTPRALIQAIVEVMRPEIGQTICDPACGTGGFLLVAHEYMQDPKRGPLSLSEEAQLRNNTFYGWEIVDNTARLCVMNLFLHGIIPDDGSCPIIVKDSLLALPDKQFSMVLSNPPFGRKSSVTFLNADGQANKKDNTIARNDFIATTSNKQLNFVQHIKSLLKVNGRAAVVLPDNVLFEGGAGEKIRADLLKTCDVHTLLRLPTGIFYAQGVKANVLFFDRREGSSQAWTKNLWIYDFRTNQNFTLRTTPLKREHLEDFVRCYNPDNRFQRQETERFRKFSYDELTRRDKTNLDIFWLRDENLEDAENLPEPDVLLKSIVDDLEGVLEQLKAIGGDLGGIEEILDSTEE